MRGLLPALCSCLLIGCSQSTPPPPAVAEQQQKPLPADESRKFPLADQADTKLIPDHMLGKSFLPGGNLADYKNTKRTWQVFLIHAPDAQKASFLLTDWRDALEKPEYLANMGGYFGLDKGTPVYVFAKGVYVAGWVGLPRAEADLLARQLAMKL
jgi:hypothetical protein